MRRTLPNQAKPLPSAKSGGGLAGRAMPNVVQAPGQNGSKQTTGVVQKNGRLQMPDQRPRGMPQRMRPEDRGGAPGGLSAYRGPNPESIDKRRQGAVSDLRNDPTHAPHLRGPQRDAAVNFLNRNNPENTGHKPAMESQARPIAPGRPPEPRGGVELSSAPIAPGMPPPPPEDGNKAQAAGLASASGNKPARELSTTGGQESVQIDGNKAAVNPQTPAPRRPGLSGASDNSGGGNSATQSAPQERGPRVEDSVGFGVAPEEGPPRRFTRQDTPQGGNNNDPNGFGIAPSEGPEPTATRVDAATKDPSAADVAERRLIEDMENGRASTREVGRDETARGQLEDLLDSDSRYIQSARNRGTVAAARSGLAGSSLAAGSAELSAINAAAPIATNDAQTYAVTARDNMQAENQRDLSEMNRDTSLYNTGRQIDSAEGIASADRASREGISAGDRTSREGIAAGDRESRERLGREGFDVEREGIQSREDIAGADRDTRTTLTREQIASNEVIAEQANQARTAVAQIGAGATVGAARLRAEAAAREGANQREFLSAQNDFEREFRRELTERGYEENAIDRAWRDESAENERDWRANESEAGRDHDAEQRGLDRDIRADEFEYGRERDQTNRDWQDAGRREQTYSSEIAAINSNPNLDEAQRRNAINDVNSRYDRRETTNTAYNGGDVPSWP